MGEFDDIIPEYITESSELLETVESGLLAMESGDLEEEAVHTVFRAIHSIKGGAGFVGLVKIERLAHRMEDLLNLIRNGDLEPTPPITDALLQSLDVLVSLFERVDEHDDIDIEGPIRALEAALNAEANEDVKQEATTPAQASEESSLPCFDISEYNIRQKLKSGNVFHLRLNLNQLEERGLTPIQLVNEMLSMGELLDSLLNLETIEDSGEVRMDVLYFTVLDADLLQAALNLEDDEIRAVGEEDFKVCFDKDSEEAPAESTPVQPAAPQAEAPAPAEAAPAPAPSPKPEPAPEAPAPAAPPPATTTTAPAGDGGPVSRGGEYLTFNLGEEHYGVDVLSVQEIIGVPHLSRLPRSPDYVLGVMNLRGNVVPVLDIRRKLGLEVAQDDDPVVVVLHVGEKIMGAVVDGVEDVLEIKDEDIQDAPDFSGTVHKDYLRGLTKRDDDLLILLELDRLLAPED